MAVRNEFGFQREVPYEAEVRDEFPHCVFVENPKNAGHMVRLVSIEYQVIEN